MNILILGGDGYLGWPTAMHFSTRGHDVTVVDNGIKRRWEQEVDAAPLWSVPTLRHRVRTWRDVSGKEIGVFVGNITNYHFCCEVFERVRPDAVVHYAEQPSAPYSMMGYQKAIDTQHNNVVGTLAVLHALQKFSPDAHLVKLGTMGEYGTPNIDIEEGWIEITHNGRKDRMLFPKKAGSFYHLSKVHDSHNIEFACRTWGACATDLNQGVVYGTDTEETALHPELVTSFHYDGIFGTALNRFIVQAIAGVPLTVYGKGKKTRGFLNIKDTLQCLELAILHPADCGEFRVFNQFTEVFSILNLTEMVAQVSCDMGIGVQIDHIENPRVEDEEHYFNPVHSTLPSLGLKPYLLTYDVIRGMLERVINSRSLIDLNIIYPEVLWKK